MWALSPWSVFLYKFVGNAIYAFCGTDRSVPYISYFLFIQYSLFFSEQENDTQGIKE